MPIQTLNNKTTGKQFREILNSNFSELSQSLATSNTNNATELTSLTTAHNDFKNAYNTVLVTSITNGTGTTTLPSKSSDEPVTLVSNEHFEQVTDVLNSQITNIIKGDYVGAGDGISITKGASGIQISAENTSIPAPTCSCKNLLINADWRHPSSHRGVYSFIKKDTSTETVAHPSIDCWEVNFSNTKNTGYSFYDAEDNRYVAYQGTSPTDNGDMSTYATLSQSFPDDWGNALIGHTLTLSVAVSTSYSDYQSGIWDIYHYTFIATNGYTGWITIPNLNQFQFGIHFNTEIANRIENELTIRFNNIWVHALKLEKGDNETLSIDMNIPVDCYKQARECEEYIQSIMFDGLTDVSLTSSYTGDTSASVSFYENQNFMGYMKNNKLYVNIPVKKPMMAKPRIEYWDANGIQLPSNTVPCIVWVNNAMVNAMATLSITNYMSGASYIQLETNLTLSDIMNVLNADNTFFGPIVVSFDYNVVFTCEETYGK